MSAKKSGHCKELAVVERWPVEVVEVQLYDRKKIVALRNSLLVNHDNCWIFFIILGGGLF